MTITITDTATPALATLGRGGRGQVRRMEALGKRIEVELRRHFDAKESQGNRRGWVRSHFWNRVVKRATSFTGATGTEAVVTVASKEFVHKVRGGTITAKAGRYLAIPLVNAAKAAGSPGEWTTKGDGQLVFVRTRRGAFLMRNRGFRGGGRIKGQRLDAWYKLVASVRHLADPTALPPASALQAAVVDQLQKEIAAEFNR